MPDTLPAGLTVEDIARRYRVGPDKVRGWCRSGAIRAINTAANLSGRPRFVVTPEALAEFEGRRAVAPPPPPRKQKKTTCAVDYYPD